MSTDWKPGDIAMVTAGGGAEVAVCCKAGAGVEGGYQYRAHWMTASCDEVWSSVEAIRPLVVIDPADARQVQGLLTALAKQRPELGITVGYVTLQAALREFASPTPPKCGAHLTLAPTDNPRGFHCDMSADHRGAHLDSSQHTAWSAS